MSQTVKQRTEPKPDASQAARKREKILAAIQALEERPMQVDTLIALGEAYFRLGTLPDAELTEAARALRQAAKYDPYSPKMPFHLGRVLWLSGDFPGAVRAFQETIKLAPQSQRAYLHLALALIEMEDAEREIGRAILDALSRGSDVDLLEQRGVLDEHMKNREKADGKPPAAQRRKKREGSGEKTDGELRWASARLVWIVDQLSRPAPNMRAVSRVFNDLAGKNGGQTDAAIVSLLMLADADACGSVKALCAENHLLEGDTPPAKMLAKALELSEVEDPAAFVEQAGKAVLAGSIPLALAGFIHYNRFGPKSELKAAEAVRLLERYPEQIQRDPFFTELRLAVLDGYAYSAYTAQRFRNAHLLWESARELDSNRVDVAHNLALVSTYLPSVDDYQRDWQRAIELRYQLAAALEDIETYSQDRIAIHQGFTRQSMTRHCDASAPLSTQDDAYPKFIADRTSIATWLEEWDLYYVNSRLQFRSPVHRLGVARDASPEEIEEARAALGKMIDASLSGKPWAGIKLFCELANERVKQAAELALDDLERGRDPYYNTEKSQAESLANEVLERSITLIKMLQYFLKELQEGRSLTGGEMRLAADMVRSYMLFPRDFLHKLQLSKGITDEEHRLDEVVLNYITNILLAGSDQEESESASKERMNAFESLSPYLPDTPQIQVARIRMLSAAKEYRKAYDLSVKTILRINAMEHSAAEGETEQEGEETPENLKALKENLISSLDHFAVSSMNKDDAALVRNGARTMEDVQRLVKALRKALIDFPRAEQIILALAMNLSHLGEDGIKEAVALLEKASEQAFTEKSRLEMVKMLGNLRTEQKKAGPRAEAIRLVKGAVDSVQKLQNNTGGVQSQDDIRAILEQAIADVERGIELAEEIGDNDLKKQAEGVLSQMRTALSNFNRRR